MKKTLAVVDILLLLFMIFYIYLIEKRKKEYKEKLYKDLETVSDSEDDKLTSEEAEALMKEFNKTFVRPYNVLVILIIITWILGIINIFI